MAIKKIISYVLAVTLLVSGISFADTPQTKEQWKVQGIKDDYNIEVFKEVLSKYYEEETYDFMWRRSDKLYFRLRDEYANGDLLKEIIFDIDTFKQQKETITKGIKKYNKEPLMLASLFYIIKISKDYADPVAVRRFMKGK